MKKYICKKYNLSLSTSDYGSNSDASILSSSPSPTSSSTSKSVLTNQINKTYCLNNISSQFESSPIQLCSTPTKKRKIETIIEIVSDVSSDDEQQQCNDENAEYEVENIVGKRLNYETNVFEYEVKWVGFKRTTWEPKSNLTNCSMLLECFESRRWLEKKHKRAKKRLKLY